MPTFRVFISSTFRDFLHEREALHARVLPRMEQYCSARGCTFEFVDLRWGISAEGESDITVDLCVDEIERCKTVSPRPNFLVLCGDRYGWRPLPSRISSENMNRLMEGLEAEDADLLRAAYHLDGNAVPPVWVSQLAASSGSMDVQRLLKVIRHGAQRLPPDEQLQLTISATHHEILAGLVDESTARADVIACFRDIDWGRATEMPAGAFSDLTPDGGRDEAAAALLHDLRSELERLVPDDRQFHYSVGWSGTDIETRHLDRFCEDVERALLTSIDQALSERAATSPATVNAGAIVAEATGITGFTSSVEESTAFLAQPGASLLLVGEGGTGKSVYAAELARRMALDDRIIVQYFAIGREPTLTTLSAIGERLRLGSRDAANGDADGDPANSDAMLNGTEPLLVVLDGLDELSEDDLRQLPGWLPEGAGADIRLFATIRPGPAQTALVRSGLFTRQVAIPELGRDDARRIVEAGLLRAGRRLTAEQMEAILAGFSQVRTPLYLRLCLEVARFWRSFDPVMSLPTTLDGAVEWALECLVGKLRLEKAFTREALTSLAASRFGLSDGELMEICSQDPDIAAAFNQSAYYVWHNKTLPSVIWLRLRNALGDLIRTRETDGVLLNGFLHRNIAEAVLRATAAEEVHLRLSDYFRHRSAFGLARSSAPSFRRSLVEAGAHATLAGDRARLAALLADPVYAFDLCFASAAGELVTSVRALRHSAGGLSDHPLAQIVFDQAPRIMRPNAYWPAHHVFLQCLLEQRDEFAVRAVQEIVAKAAVPDNLLLARPKWQQPNRPSDIAMIEAHRSLAGLIELAGGRLLSWGCAMTGPRTELGLWSPAGEPITIIPMHEPVAGAQALASGDFLIWTAGGCPRLTCWSEDGYRLFTQVLHPFAELIEVGSDGWVALGREPRLQFLDATGALRMNVEFAPGRLWASRTVADQICTAGPGPAGDDDGLSSAMRLWNADGSRAPLFHPLSGEILFAGSAGEVTYVVSNRGTLDIAHWTNHRVTTFNIPDAKQAGLVGENLIIATGRGILVIDPHGQCVFSFEDPQRAEVLVLDYNGDYIALEAGGLLFVANWRQQTVQHVFASEPIELLHSGAFLSTSGGTTAYHDTRFDFRRRFDDAELCVVQEHGTGAFVDRRDRGPSLLGYLKADGTLLSMKLHSSPVKRVLSLTGGRFATSCQDGTEECDGAYAIWPQDTVANLQNIERNEKRLSLEEFRRETASEAHVELPGSGWHAMQSRGSLTAKVKLARSLFRSEQATLSSNGRQRTKLGKADGGGPMGLNLLSETRIALTYHDCHFGQRTIVVDAASHTVLAEVAGAGEPIGRCLLVDEGSAKRAPRTIQILSEDNKWHSFADVTHLAWCDGVLWFATRFTLHRLDLAHSGLALSVWQSQNWIQEFYLRSASEAIVLVASRVLVVSNEAVVGPH